MDGLDGGDIRIGDIPAYYAAPKSGGKRPVVLVVAEVFGLHEHIKDVVRRVAKEGYFAMRLRFPDGYRVQAHWHPNTERVTVISGTLNLAMGDKFGEGPVRALPAGSYSFMPPGMHHWAWATGPTELQLATIGPWRIIYINPADDPRNASGAKSK